MARLSFFKTSNHYTLHSARDLALHEDVPEALVAATDVPTPLEADLDPAKTATAVVNVPAQVVAKPKVLEATLALTTKAAVALLQLAVSKTNNR